MYFAGRLYNLYITFFAIYCTESSASLFAGLFSQLARRDGLMFHIM